MIGVLVFIVIFALIVLGVPVATSIFMGGVFYVDVTDSAPLLILMQKLVKGLDSFTLLAIPLFILLGIIMEKGGISKRIVDWATSLIGSVSGGIGAVCIVSCAIFAALTGSNPATVAAIGSLTIPAMVDSGYTKQRATGLVATAGNMGQIIPPSMSMIVYGCTMQVSITDMFVGGVMPGILIAFSMIVLNGIMARKNPEIMRHKGEIKFSFKNFLLQTWKSLGALLIPVIILGGIYFGVFTPTESAAVGVFFSLILGLFIYKELTIKELPDLLLRSMKSTAMITFIMGAANILTWVLAVTQLPNLVATKLLPLISTQALYLFVLVLLLLVLGALIDTVVAIVIVAPIFIPLGVELGLDPIHLGVLFCVNLAVGFCTPPFGYNLFMAQTVSGLKFEEVVKGCIPYLLLQIALLFVIAYCPAITTWLPSMMN